MTTTKTPIYGFNLPATGDVGWGDAVNANFSGIETLVNGIQSAPISVAWLIANVNNLVLVSATRDTNEAIVSASVAWPDGVAGVFSTDTVNATYPSAIDAYHVTYLATSGTRTVTQAPVTRDANGAVIAQPMPSVT